MCARPTNPAVPDAQANKRSRRTLEGGLKKQPLHVPVAVSNLKARLMRTFSRTCPATSAHASEAELPLVVGVAITCVE
eukprot:scaffold222145_cov15-Tisochrysis_lutea.AAC.1